MTELYGHKWTSVHGMGDDSGNWGKIFSGIDKHQIAHGVRAWTAQPGDLAKWPPGAIELREFCMTKASIGVPTAEAAWREAAEASSNPNEWKFSHPIVQEAARLTDWYSIRTGTPKPETVQNRFNKRYADLLIKVQRGEPLVDQQLMLSHEKSEGLRERTERMNDSIVTQRIRDQGLNTKTTEQIREELRQRFGIAR